MRVGVMVKQVPAFESLALGSDGRLIRDGRGLEMNPYCRRAVSKGVELAGLTGGRCTVFTLGPPAAADVLAEAIAWGADDAVFISDPAFAGSDTLATARALAAAISREGPFDLILAGRNSVDADTGQVGPELAELLGLPFVGGVRRLELLPGSVAAELELDDGWAQVEVDLPAVISCAERLCQPAKVDADRRAAVDQRLIRLVTAADLGPGPWGQAASPTRVGDIRVLEVNRGRRVLSGTVAQQVATAVEMLRDAGALPPPGDGDSRTDDRGAEPARSVPDDWVRGEKVVAVLVEPQRDHIARELLGAAAGLARAVHGRVIALVADADRVSAPGTAGGPAGAIDSEAAGTWGAGSRPGAAVAEERVLGVIDPEAAGTWGADELVALAGGSVAEDIARAIGAWADQVQPWAVLAPSTMWGREVAARVAAHLGAGLTGDAVDLATDRGRLVGWKPAFGGRLVAAITADSPVQLATVRAGMLRVPAPRSVRPLVVAGRPVIPAGRVRVLGSGRNDDLDQLATARVVVGVGVGVGVDEYHELTPLLDALGAQLAATRKVTDRGWLPRARQIGLTGRSISPLLYVAVGLSGKFNHLVGVRGAGQIVAVNDDPEAPVFNQADIGIVGDWHEAVPLLVKLIRG